MKFVKWLLVLEMVLPVVSAARALEEHHIWVMDFREFSFIDHKTGKRRYADLLIQYLKKLKIKTEGFDYRTADRHELWEVMVSEKRYPAVVEKIDEACGATANRRVCMAMEKLRWDSLEWNKANPESAD